MHYLVTGGCGFIGSHLVRRLLAGGHGVTIMDDLSNACEQSAPSAARLIVRDITEPNALDGVIAEIDGVFHLAAIVSVTQSAQLWRATHQVTLGGTVALLDAIARSGRKLPVVYASSAAVYGDSASAPFSESGPCAPISAYGADKLGCELHARVGWLVHAIPSAGLRFFNVYGPGQDPASPYAGVISIFADRARRNLPVTIYGDGEQTRDYIYVADVADAMFAAMGRLEGKTLTHGVFNVCTGRPITVNALAALIAPACAVHHCDPRPGDIRISTGDPEQCAKALGFRSATSLKDGLEFTLKTV